MVSKINSNQLNRIFYWFFVNKISDNNPQQRRINRNEVLDTSIPRRAQIARNQRHRNTQAATSHQDSDDSNDDENRSNAFAENSKIGTKKRAKLEAKAERKIQREQEMVAREEKKKKDALFEAERKKAELAKEVCTQFCLLAFP